MAYSTTLADRLRAYLADIPDLKVEEKAMFRGLAFLVNGKMCVNASGENLMCRFDPDLEPEVVDRKGFQPMIMKGKQLRGYCYVSEGGYKAKRDFEFWLKLCLDFNGKARALEKEGRRREESKSLPTPGQRNHAESLNGNT